MDDYKLRKMIIKTMKEQNKDKYLKKDLNG